MMNHEIEWPEQVLDVPALTVPAVEGFFRRQVFKLLTRLADCELTVVEAGRAWRFGSASQGSDLLKATIFIHDNEVYRQIALGGSIGVAEAYIHGEWVADDLVQVVRIFVRNRDLLDAMEGGFASVASSVLGLWHKFQRNTKRGSRKNISAHYDLGNQLFELFLDESMMYSSAIYTNSDDTLEQAQQRRLDRICDKLALQPTDHLLEIGTGWGGLAIHAAKRHGCKVTTTTISTEQYEFAKVRVETAGLAHLITLRCDDYRDLSGHYDKLVSIEMIEAIGHQYLDTYFAKLSTLLKPDGLALVQAITIEDHRYQVALKGVDFIKRYIFPGSFIPSISAMLGSAAKSGDLKLSHLEDIGPSYALTLREWRRRFLGHREQVLAQGYSVEFVRLFDYYFAYCEGGFLERAIGDVQLLMAKPMNRRTQFLPDLGSTV